MNTTRFSALAAILPFFLPASAFSAAFDFNGALRWTNGVVPYAWDATTTLVHYEPTDEHKKQAEKVMRGWQKAANINFVKRTTEADYVFISETRLPGVNFSWVAKSGGAQPLWIDNWEDRIILHELGHALGLAHEHQRSDRDQFVDCWWWHALTGTQINFTRENTTKHTEVYDYLSLMHYHESAFAAPWFTTTYTLHPKNVSYLGRMGRETWFGKDGTQETYLNPVIIGHAEEYRSVGAYGYLSPWDRVGIQSEYGLPNSISGFVRLNGVGLGVSAKMRLTGAGNVVDTVARMRLTKETPRSADEVGYFKFEGLPTGTYTFTPELPGYTFSPPSITVALSTGIDLTQQNFSAIVAESTPPTVDITTGATNEKFQTLPTLTGTAGDGTSQTSGLASVRVVVHDWQERWYNWGDRKFEDTAGPFNAAAHEKPLTTSLNNWAVYMNPLNTLPDGGYRIQAKAVDNAGNESPWEDQWFLLDNTDPTLTLELPSSVIDLTDIHGTAGDALEFLGAAFIIKDLTESTTWNGTDWVSYEGNGHVFQTTMEGDAWRPKIPTGQRMPGRADMQDGHLYSVFCESADTAGNTKNESRNVTRIPADTSVPTLSVASPLAGSIIEPGGSLPAVWGNAEDPQTSIGGLDVYILRAVPGGFLSWTGLEWSETQTPLAGSYEESMHRWDAPKIVVQPGGATYGLPSGSDLPAGSYQIQTYIRNREVPAGTNGVTVSFRVGYLPEVAVTSVTHNGLHKAGWTLAGTVSDSAGAGFANGNRVSLNINLDGQYWDGDSWVSSPTTVYADILPDNTWVYPGTTAGAQLPVGDGIYSVSAHVTDNQNYTNAVVAGGLPGNNQVIFTLDATPPQLVLTSPAPGTTIDASPLPANWINGTAYDSSGAVTVSFRLKRNIDGFMPERFWNGEMWKEEFFFFGPDIDLDGTFPADNGPTSWKFAGHQPRPGWDGTHCMINGSYEVIAVATDLAGNETTLTRPFTVDHHPEYIPPAFENMPLQPLQVPPFPTSALGGNNASSFNPLNPLILPEDTRFAHAQKLAGTPTGPYYIASSLIPSVPGQGTAAVVVQRLGSSAWRDEDSDVSAIGALKTDSAGNLYALYQSNVSARAVLVKYTPAGAFVWARFIPEIENDPAYIAAPTLKRMDWLPDGTLGLLFSIHTNYGGGGSYSVTMAMAAVETDGDVRYRKVFGMVDTQVEAHPDHFESAPVDFAGDAAGNVFLASIETERYTGWGQPQAPEVRRIIRKLSPAGVTLATHVTDTCDFPEHWERLATDPAGNLYVAGRFMGGIRSETDHGRQEMLKFDNNLAFQWRAFGPPRTPEAGDMVVSIDAGADGVMTIDNSGMAAFFTPAGALKWARPIIQGGGIAQLFTFPGGSAVGILYTGTTTLTAHLVKISRAGDTQFDLAFDTNYDQIIDLIADTGDICLLRQGFSGQQPYLDRYYNIPDTTIPVTLDPVYARDQVLIAGDALEMKVINSGSLATGYQWRKYDSGIPVNISGATSDKFTIGSLVMGDAGQFDCVVTNPHDSATSRTATLSVLAPAAFDIALDTPGRTWTTGGDAPFVGFMAQNPAGPAHDDTDAIMNRPLGLNQTAFIETTVTGPGSVTFWWKSANAEFPDDFTFSIDGDELDLIRGVQDWAPVAQNFGPGTHTLRWEYYKFSNSTAINDRVWLDEIVIAGNTAVSLPDALDTTGLNWRTSAGGLAWTGITSLSHDGTDSATSGTTGNNQQSYVEVDVMGPGTLTFWWKVSCEPNWDRLAFTIDESPSGSITGEQDWVQATRTIPAGPKTLRWSYDKDEIGFGGLDKAWLDQVVFTPGGAAGPEIVVERDPNHSLTDNTGFVDFGAALPANNTVRTFTIRNTGTAPLTGLFIIEDGSNPPDFAFSALSSNSVNPGGTATFSVTFTPLSAGAKTAAIYIASNDADENTFDIELRGTGGVPITSWRQTHFGTTANTGAAADDADDDDDGVPNLLEFATTGTPGAPDEEPGELAPMDDSGLLYFTYTRNKQAMAEVSYQVEWTDDLLLAWSTAGVVETIVHDNGLIQTVTATLPAGPGGRRFVRLRVTRAP